MQKKYDAIVVGAGHAGVEAALALSRMGNKTLVLTLNLDSVSFLACNPSIGGTSKGQLVSEVDALGGQMGINTDATCVQLRLLNKSKGPAVQSLRAQVDKNQYHQRMKNTLENTENLELKEAEVKEILVKNKQIVGIKTTNDESYFAKTVIVATGVYLNSHIITGKNIKKAGPAGFSSATYLTKSLIRLGFTVRRFKTGTPPRVNINSVDTTLFEEQPGDENIQTFSYLTKKQPQNLMVCFLGYTTQETKKIIQENIHKSPMYSGVIEGIGARYCPSIEDKIVRFADKDRHQIFLEPETSESKEYYVQGLSTSMPTDVQQKLVNSIEGMENGQIMRYGYAIEYDCVDPRDLYPTLQYKNIKGLYTAGQINGTSGYEEAAAQGLLAGINASLYISGQPEMILGRNSSYIGVLIDDLVTKGTNEPYRMMTSRAEFRLHLRQDNADQRLTEIGKNIGLVDKKRYNIYKKKLNLIKKLKNELEITKIRDSKKLQDFYKLVGESPIEGSITAHNLLRRTKVDLAEMSKYFDLFTSYPLDVLRNVNIEYKYEGYLVKQESLINKNKKLENMRIPSNLDYNKLYGIRIEAKQKLSETKPLSIGQASRIPGVSPADISVLIFYINKK